MKRLWILGIIIAVGLLVQQCSQVNSVTVNQKFEITWVSPGDNALTGPPVKGYDFRWAYTLDSLQTKFANCQQIPYTKTPKAAGTPDTLIPTLAIKTGVPIFFAGKAVDSTNNWSMLSAVASVTVPDTIPPMAPQNVVVKAVQ